MSELQNFINEVGPQNLSIRILQLLTALAVYSDELSLEDRKSMNYLRSLASKLE